MVELCRRDDLMLDLGALRYVAHWVTPAGEGTRRFDTRFFLAAAPPDQEGAHDDTETVHSMWVRPVDVLGQAERRELLMMPPTIATLRWIADCSSTAGRVGTGRRRAAAGTHPAPPAQELRRQDHRRRPPSDPDYADLT